MEHQRDIIKESWAAYQKAQGAIEQSQRLITRALSQYEEVNKALIRQTEFGAELIINGHKLTEFPPVRTH